MKTLFVNEIHLNSARNTEDTAVVFGLFAMPAECCCQCCCNNADGEHFCT